MSKAMIRWTLWFDGSCEPCNPGGHACGGWLIRDDQHRLLQKGAEHFGSGEGMTNNFAEYMALLSGLVWLHDRKRDGLDLTVLGDSKLVVSQLSKSWKCKNERLLDLRNQCWMLLDEMQCRWTVRWIPRERNQEADDLSKSIGGQLPPLNLTDAQRRQMWAVKSKKRRKR